MLRLNHDLVRTIMLRLPVKSIGQCQVVCNSWYKIINDQFFVDSHIGMLHNHETRAGAQEGDYILVHQRPPVIVESGVPTQSNQFSYHDRAFNTTNTIELDSPIQNDRGNLELVGCCCGLICLFDSQNIYFWNPTLGKSIIIPKKPDFRNLYFWNPALGMKSRIIPGESNFSAAIGENFGYAFVPQLKDFKLVRIISIRTLGKQKFYRQVNVFALNSNIWRRLGTEDFPCVYFDSHSSQATVNSIVHWPALDSTHCDLVILAFDMMDEVFRKISPPPNDDNDHNFNSYSSLATYKGCLCIFWTRHGLRDMWVMKDYGVQDAKIEYTGL